MAIGAERYVTPRGAVSAGLIESFRNQEVTTVYEAAGRQGAMDRTIRAIQPLMRLCGTARTVRCQPGDNLTLHLAIAMAKPGEVIVADVGGFLDAGHWGEITTVAAQARGVVGLVINGSVRDVAALAQRDFPTFAGGISMKAALKEVRGEIDCPIYCGGVSVQPGDLLLGDADGVVVVPHQTAEAVLQATIDRERHEATVMRRVEAGELTVDILGLRPAIDRYDPQIGE